MRNHIPKKKKKTTAQLKKQLDKLFSEYVRRKDAVNGLVSCFTCGRQMEWKYSQCGHFVSRKHTATRYDLENVRVQCVGCNVFGRGNTAVFGLRLEKYCEGMVKALFLRSQKIVKDFPYQREIDNYKQLLKDL